MPSSCASAPTSLGGSLRAFVCSISTCSEERQTFILAADESRALNLARRELVDGGADPVLELREAHRVLWRGLASSLAGARS